MSDGVTNDLTARGIMNLLSRPIDATDLERNTELLASPRPQSLREQATLLLFRVGGERLALPAHSVGSVFPVRAVRRVPHRTRPPFRGLCCHEGAILLTGALHVVLDMPAGDGGDPAARRMIVIGGGESGWAFEVDAVESIRRVDPTSFRPAPATVPSAAGQCTVCLVPLEDGDAVLLNPEAIAAAMERSIQ